MIYRERLILGRAPEHLREDSLGATRSQTARLEVDGSAFVINVEDMARHHLAIVT